MIDRIRVAVLTLVLISPPVAAQHRPQPGVATARLGSVHFLTSCSDAASLKFDRAVALLHSFEFGRSISGFTDVLAVDPTCAMAYWGIALSHWGNPMAPGNRSAAALASGRAATAAAAQLSSNATDREGGYIAAVGALYADGDQAPRVLAYERSMRELARRYPADTEAQIFHAIALVAAAPPSDKTFANQLEAGAILETFWAQQPNHPGLAHYIIHAYDVPALAPRARAAANRYAAIAPAAAHALHMPSHTFTRLGLWRESIATNLRSIAAARQSGSIAEMLHASDYAEYAYLQLGENTAAKAIVDGLPALAARFDPAAVTGAAPGSAGVYALAAVPARYAIERHDWKLAAALRPLSTAFPYADAMTWLARALGAAHTGDLVDAATSMDSIASIRQRLANQGEGYWADQVAIEQFEAAAWLAFASGRSDSAVTLMRAAVARDDATEKSAVTPGPLAPAHELMGDLLLALKRPADARAEYRQTLTKEPNRRHSLRGIVGLRPSRSGSRPG